jgi:hypothetical protein
MPDSIQLHILKAITIHLQGVTPANDYDFDLSAAVFRGRLLYGDDVPLPMVSIVEHLQGDITTDTAGENQIERTETWILLVQGITRNAIENPTDETYNLKAAVEHRLARTIKMNAKGDPEFPDEYFFGLRSLKAITGLTIGPGIVSPPREGISSRAFFYLPLGVGLATDISNPYAS